MHITHKCRPHVEINIVLNAKKIFAGTDATKKKPEIILARTGFEPLTDTGAAL